MPTVEDIDGRRTDCKRIMMISAMVLFLLLSKMIFPAPHSFPITLTLHTPFSAYQSSKKHAMKRPRQDPSIPNRLFKTSNPLQSSKQPILTSCQGLPSIIRPFICTHAAATSTSRGPRRKLHVRFSFFCSQHCCRRRRLFLEAV